MTTIIKEVMDRKLRDKGRNKPSLSNLLCKGDDISKFQVLKINEEIGFGVFALTDFSMGEFLMEYRGNWISQCDVLTLQRKYENENIGSYIYFDVVDIFGKKKCIDATNVDGIGKLVNDSPSRLANSKMRRVIVGNSVHLCLFATRHITAGTEVRYDYGEDRAQLPWRKEKWKCHPLKSKDVSVSYFEIMSSMF
ncbi:N-lysine methyltransferase KMT5A-A-like [Hydractinia symbiolongicarpus]|uniref:N-lysine methyltransferase KMT5A-A-like n=1 Tax=Hydractinia symbiolongicarpus TaxID=13093 RepID=UPI00254BBDF1|nr:N-lysine methyltransferase KMT5A-A-like [Hydractinia symbiolongicarpus]